MSPLYHGTRAGFHGRGGLVLPAVLTGRPVTGGGIRDDEGQHVYVTPDHSLACVFAHLSSGRGKPKVLTVTPLGPLEIDIATFDGEEREAYRCEAAVVEAVQVLKGEAA